MPLSDPQKLIANDKRRFKVAICGRRFGKTTLAIWLMCREASQPNREIFYIAPTYRQAKMIAWRKLKNKLLDLRWAKKINETELSIQLKNNSIISLKGADGGAQNLRGVGLNAVILDEAAIIDEEAWTEVLRPALADKQGWALFISTPAGMNWLKELYDLAEEFPEEWVSYQFTSLDGGNIPKEEIEAARRTLDEKTFSQEFLATFETFSGRVFYSFNRKNNLKIYNEKLPEELHIGCDFNIDPMSAVVGIKQGNNLHVIDEIRIMGSNTDELVTEIKNRYPNQKIIIYPDPAGSQRRSSAGGRTDHTILRMAGFRVLAPSSHNLIRDGVNAVNAKLCSSTGIITLFIDPKCKYLIESLEKHVYKEGTSIPEKGGKEDYSHMNDALRYMVDFMFPIRQPNQNYERSIWSHRLAA